MLSCGACSIVSHSSNNSAGITRPSSVYALICLAVLIVCGKAIAQQQSIEFAVNPSSATQQEVYHLLAKNFEMQNPDIKVNVSSRQFSDHKILLEQMAKGARLEADVILGYAGEQLNTLIAADRVARIDALWADNNLDAVFNNNTKEAVSSDGQVFAIPLNYYQWGIYYKKTVFDKHGFAVPRSWQAFIKLIEELRESGITPFLLSGGTTWTLAAWFDYINLRLNGLQFHRQLLAGEIPFTNPKVNDVFVLWQQVIKAGAFEPEQIDSIWTEGLPYFYRDYAAMSLMGNFFIAQVPAPVVESIGFFPFPAITKEMPTYENVPIDIAVLNKDAANNSAAKAFLLYLASVDTQVTLSNYVGKIAANQFANSQTNSLVAMGQQQINEADGFAQFFDRDSPKDFSEPAMAIFKQFMINPDDIDATTTALEKLRKKAFIGKN